MTAPTRLEKIVPESSPGTGRDSLFLWLAGARTDSQDTELPFEGAVSGQRLKACSLQGICRITILNACIKQVIHFQQTLISITAQTTSIKYRELVANFNEPMLLGSIFLVQAKQYKCHLGTENFRHLLLDQNKQIFGFICLFLLQSKFCLWKHFIYLIFLHNFRTKPKLFACNVFL